VREPFIEPLLIQFVSVLKPLTSCVSINAQCVPTKVGDFHTPSVRSFPRGGGAEVQGKEPKVKELEVNSSTSMGKQVPSTKFDRFEGTLQHDATRLHLKGDGDSSNGSGVRPYGKVGPQVLILINDAVILQVPAVKLLVIPGVVPGPLRSGQEVLVKEVVQLLYLPSHLLTHTPSYLRLPQDILHKYM
jgi:hypothetical protein